MAGLNSVKSIRLSSTKSERSPSGTKVQESPKNVRRWRSTSTNTNPDFRCDHCYAAAQQLQASYSLTAYAPHGSHPFYEYAASPAPPLPPGYPLPLGLAHNFRSDPHQYDRPQGTPQPYDQCQKSAGDPARAGVNCFVGPDYSPFAGGYGGFTGFVSPQLNRSVPYPVYVPVYINRPVAASADVSRPTMHYEPQKRTSDMAIRDEKSVEGNSGSEGSVSPKENCVGPEEENGEDMTAQAVTHRLMENLVEHKKKMHTSQQKQDARTSIFYKSIDSVTRNGHHPDDEESLKNVCRARRRLCRTNSTRTRVSSDKSPYSIETDKYEAIEIATGDLFKFDTPKSPVECKEHKTKPGFEIGALIDEHEFHSATSIPVAALATVATVAATVPEHTQQRMNQLLAPSEIDSTSARAFEEDEVLSLTDEPQQPDEADYDIVISNGCGEPDEKANLTDVPRNDYDNTATLQPSRSSGFPLFPDRSTMSSSEQKQSEKAAILMLSLLTQNRSSDMRPNLSTLLSEMSLGSGRQQRGAAGAVVTPQPHDHTASPPSGAAETLATPSLNNIHKVPTMLQTDSKLGLHKPAAQKSHVRKKSAGRPACHITNAGNPNYFSYY